MSVLDWWQRADTCQLYLPQQWSNLRFMVQSKNFYSTVCKHPPMKQITYHWISAAKKWVFRSRAVFKMAKVAEQGFPRFLPKWPRLFLEEVDESLNFRQPCFLLLLLGQLQSLLPLDRLLTFDLLVVELGEVVDDNGNGESHHKHTRNGAASTWWENRNSLVDMDTLQAQDIFRIGVSFHHPTLN